MESPTSSAPTAPSASGASHSHLPPKDVLLDRALGAVLGGALGEALGLNSGGRWGANTSMAISMLQSMVQGSDLSTEDERRKLVNRWIAWYRRGGQGVDTSTQGVFDGLSRLSDQEVPNAALHSLQGKIWFNAMPVMSDLLGPSGSNDPLARVAPLVLVYLEPGAEASLVNTVTALATLAHHRTYVGDAAALWALAMRHAILTGETGIAVLRALLIHLPEERRHDLLQHIDAAEEHILNPSSSSVRSDNRQARVAMQQALVANCRGFDVPSVLQAAATWEEARAAAAVDNRAVLLARSDPAATPLKDDKAGVAAIAGQLAGARYGAGSMPKSPVAELHGFPNDMRADDLRRLVQDILERYDGRYP